MNWLDLLKEGISALLGTLGFSLLFGLRRRDRLIVATIGGVLVWGTYAVMRGLVPDSLFVCNFIPAVVGTLYSQALARVMRAPATLFMFPSIIVLVPGGMLYYTMNNIIIGKMNEGIKQLLDTMKVTIGLAFGIVIAMALIKLIYFVGDKKILRRKRR